MWTLTDEAVKNIRFSLKILHRKCEQWHDNSLFMATDRIEKELNSGRKDEQEKGAIDVPKKYKLDNN